MALNDALPDDVRTILLEPCTRLLFRTGIDSDLERKRWQFIWQAVFRRILLQEPEEKLLFIDLIGKIERCRRPRKWELAVKILNEAMTIGKHS